MIGLKSRKQKAVLGVSAGATLGLAIIGAMKLRRNGKARLESRGPQMQVRESLNLQLQWKKNGGGTCEHPVAVPEFYKDTATGYTVCTTCGVSVK